MHHILDDSLQVPKKLLRQIPSIALLCPLILYFLIKNLYNKSNQPF